MQLPVTFLAIIILNKDNEKDPAFPEPFNGLL